MEEWKDMIGYEGVYQVSNMGRIKSLFRICETRKGVYRPIRERILKQWVVRKYMVSPILGRQTPIHRIVAKHFIPLVDGKTQVNHKDGNKFNNTADNLEWCNQSENTQHAYDMGLIPSRKGESNPNHKSKKRIAA